MNTLGRPVRAVARVLHHLIKKRPADGERGPYSKDGLGKFPYVIAVGHPLTREQTNDVMLRTTYWRRSCNDEAWNDMVVHILGLADQLNANLVEFSDGSSDWDWQYRTELIHRFGESIGVLHLFALDNPAIMSHQRGAGWLDWSGRIRARYTDGSKWTTIAEVESDWRDIAAAFPFLCLRAQIAAGDYLNDLPSGTVGAEWIITGGTVTRVKPGKALIGPERWWHKHHDDWYQFFWWGWKIATPIRNLYYWQNRRYERRWPHIGPWSLAMHWEERGTSAARLIEAVDQIKESVMDDTFTVTELHLRLLRRFNLEWDDTEQGAPAVDPRRPYGTKWVLHDLAELLDPEGFAAVPEGDDAALGAYEQEHAEALMRAHRETFKALDIVLATGQFTAGTYRRSDPWARDWKLIDSEETAA